VTGRWIRARYVAERHEIAARYVEWEIVGPPEIRNVEASAAAYFNPWRQNRPMPRLRYPVFEAN
jgi:hypothetical protein